MQILPTQFIPLTGGGKLATDVYLPDGAGPFPTIVIRTPYGRKGARLQRKAGLYTSHGFAVVLQDVRATGDSSILEPFYPWRAEREDGAATLRWVEGQVFCNGRIGTHGGSYLATSQWLTAADSPPSLRCMVAYVGPHSFYDGYYSGGVHHLCITLSYGLVMSGGVTAATGGWPGMHKRFWHLPVCDADLVEGRHCPLFQDMIRTPAGDPYWQTYNALANPAQIKAPVLQLGGWFDFYPKPSLQAFTTLRQQGGSADVRNGSKILIGAWSHDREGSRCRDLDFGPNVCMDLFWHEIRWFRYWLMDQPTGIETEPAVRVFTMGANTWQDFPDWPPPDAGSRPLYLHSRGRANTRHGDGQLAWESPVSEATDAFRYDPLDPVPTVGGNHSCDYASIPAGPMDQSAVEERPDVLVYSSAILKQPVEIAGPVRVQLWAASSAPDTDFTAKLVDVQPDGRPINLSEGIVRASYRHGRLAPGKVNEFGIELVDLSHVFLPGHQIRLEISPSNFPKYVRNLNTGADNHTTSETAVAAQTIYHDTAHPSALWLWVRETRGAL